MQTSSRSGIFLPVISLLSALTLSAQAEEQGNKPGQPPSKPAVQAAKPAPGHPPVAGAGPHQNAGGGAPQGARMARGAPPARVYGGNPYRGRVAWEGGRWRHEMHNGRDGWWWDVGGVWYYYPQAMQGPPTYISEDYADDVGYPAGPPVADGAYAPPPGAYAPPPPPPPDPAASAVGGAIVGGLLGGLLTGRASGAAAGAVVGGATGAIAGATAASRPGYYFAEGNCYYRYPSGQYVQADPRACY
ncbi:MAG: hypothetical protein ACXWLT_07915 [Rhizomicrobium sp.]